MIRELVGFWIICMSVTSFLIFTIEEDIKQDVFYLMFMGVFLAALEFGVWMLLG